MLLAGSLPWVEGAQSKGLGGLGVGWMSRAECVPIDARYRGET